MPEQEFGYIVAPFKHLPSGKSFGFARGYHSYSYRLLKELQITPAEGSDLSLIVKGAFSNAEGWKDLRQTCLAWRSGGIRVPHSVLVSRIEGQQGILIARDIEGLGTTREMNCPTSLNASDGWQEDQGVWRNENLGQVWVEGTYSDEEIKEDDKVARGILTREGARTIYQTAVDNHLTPYRWMPPVDKEKTAKRVGLLLELDGRLFLDLDYSSDFPDSSAFGWVKIDAEGVAKK